MMSAKIQDFSGDVYVQFIKELGDPIMNGMTAKEFKDFKETNDQNEVKEFIKTCYYKTHSIVVKVSND